MRTTLVIDDDLFRRLKRRAAEEGRTLSDVTQETLRQGLVHSTKRRRLKHVALRVFRMGAPLIDIADRDQLFDVLDHS